MPCGSPPASASLPRELLRFAATPSPLIYRPSDFIKSLIPLVIYTVFDECHQSRCEDLMAALICLFNGVVERKVVTARCGTKRWVTGPVAERWKGEMQSSQVAEGENLTRSRRAPCIGEDGEGEREQGGGKIAPLAEHGCKYKKHVGVARVLQPVVCCSAFSIVKMLWITGGKNVVQMRNLYLTKTLNATNILMIYFVVDIDQHRYLRGVTVKSINCKKQQFYILSKTFLFDLEIANGRARRSHCGN